MMALVYAQDMSAGNTGNLLNYSAREQQSIGGGGGGNSTDCSVQHLCYEPSSLCNSVSRQLCYYDYDARYSMLNIIIDMFILRRQMNIRAQLQPSPTS